MKECKWPLQIRTPFGLEGHNSRQIMAVIGLETDDQPGRHSTSKEEMRYPGSTKQVYALAWNTFVGIE